MASPFGSPGAGLTGEELNMRCGHVDSRGVTCDIVYEDHDDEALGHIFVEPEADGRDY